METHIGSKIKEVVKERQYSVGNLATTLGLHIGSISRIYAYKSIQTDQLKKISIYLKYDFFALYSTELDIKKVVVDTTSATEKLLFKSEEEVAALKKEIVYLKEINELLRKKQIKFEYSKYQVSSFSF